ncbi:MotA/TolQ/ExbB proton channel family protein [Aquibium sp. ELW1220]|uniref:MotA/TolQ/ExbB proton channel family protein n=1 Tax=Aquibium sp. ELW1220 TaxID=2976766 RepID=UPI0025B0EE87|nr:MotA/TolQ/ExbB proton channel family protein [Aquibium sp. ELW1220]MDN2581403.1 MotA/TolQ/ExbB proton channel family protein [Aquibium sp. ELW1220]
MTSAGATTEPTTREAARLLGFRAALFALIAAIAQVLALLLVAPDFAGTPRLAIGVLIAAAPLLAACLSFAPVLRPLASAGIFFSSVATAAVVLSFVPGDDPGGMTPQILSASLAGLAFWPVIALCLSAGRALDDLALRSAVMASLRRPARTAAAPLDGSLVRSAGALALYALAATIALLSLLFFAATILRRPASLEWLISTPVHVAILMLFCAICILLAQSWLDHLRSGSPGAGDATGDAAALRAAAQRRLLRTLIGLLPVLGFLGTVLGIMQALASLPVALTDQPAAQDAGLAESLRGIATAFETTLLGLVGSVAATLVLASIERAEDMLQADASSSAPEAGP